MAIGLPDTGKDTHTSQVVYTLVQCVVHLFATLGRAV